MRRTSGHPHPLPATLALPLSMVLSMSLVLAAPGAVRAQGLTSDQQLQYARVVQNPVAAMITLPFQNNSNFGYGPDGNVQNVLNIQPIWPVRLNPSYNLITRTIVPVLYQPVINEGGNSTWGMGDINETLFLSPAVPRRVIYGIGLTGTFPTASDAALGAKKWSGGPALVVLKMTGPWVIGALANNQWSYAGDDGRADVNAFLLQYFINYNFANGWFLNSAPINTANWQAPSADQWTVPVGGGVGKIFRAGAQAMNAQVGAYYNVRKPEHLPTADWTLRLQLGWMYPK